MHKLRHAVQSSHAHLGLALIPAINTMLLAMQMGYVLVSLIEQIWTAHLRTWWNHPVSGR